MVSEELKDRRIRMMAFDWLTKQVELFGDVIPRKLLSEGFQFEGQRVPLISPQGIFKPKVMSNMPLTITTAPQGPYDDRISGGELLLYKYRGTDPMHRDNVGLRESMKHQVPLIYLYGVARGRYLAVWPVYIVGDDPTNLTFTVAVDEARFLSSSVEKDWNDLRVSEGDVDDARRIYITSTIKRRLHQRSFRERVLRAYRDQCSLCRLRHLELLDAAHIMPDSSPEGEPVVSNGISLCKLHHAAFDRHILGINPDYQVEIRQDILDEIDGPMLKHGLQQLHDAKIYVPREEKLRPDPILLEKRYAQFKEAI